MNVGSGEDLSIRDVAGIVAEETGYTGDTYWDPGKPDGTRQRLLDTSTLTALGWRPRIGLREGIRSTIEWYRTHRADMPA